MNEREHLLVCLSEECNEIIRECNDIIARASKALRFGESEVQPGQLKSNVDRLVDEMKDLLAVARKLEKAGIIRADSVAAKDLKVDTFMALARECGALS